MTPRTLWTIILKIFGLYMLLQLFYPLSQILAFILGLTQQHDQFILLQFSAVIFSASIYLLLLATFLFKTDWLIDKLRLDKGFNEEKIELNIHRSTVLKIVVILTGLMLFIESLPTFLRELFTYYQNINDYNGFKRYPEGGTIILNLAKVLISLFMLTSSRLIVNFIERKRKGSIPASETKK
jgi:hypothetical protein